MELKMETQKSTCMEVIKTSNENNSMKQRLGFTLKENPGLRFFITLQLVLSARLFSIYADHYYELLRQFIKLSVLIIC